VYGNVLLAAQFCCQPKTVLKNKGFFVSFETQADLKLLGLSDPSAPQPPKYWNYRRTGTTDAVLHTRPFFFLVALGFELRASSLDRHTLPPEPLCQPLLLWLF
jgi:hypothetical protein